MSFRHRKAPARVGAGLLLAAACTLGPAAAMAAPHPSDVEPTQAETCRGANMEVDKDTIELGETVTFTGECVGEGSFESITILVEGAEVGTANSQGGGTFAFEHSPPKTGDFRATAMVHGETVAYADFTVKEAEEPDEPEDPEEPEEPGEPEEPEDPDEPEEPEENEENEDGNGANGNGEGDEDSNQGGTGEDDDGNNSGNVDGDEDADSKDQDQADDTTPSPKTDDSETADEGTTLPPEASGPSPGSPAPASPAPASPDPAPQDVPSPSAGPQQPDAQQRMLDRALLLGETLANMGAEDDSDAGDSDSPSDGGGELADTGVELSAGAGVAALTIGAGAGLVGYQRRQDSRREN